MGVIVYVSVFCGNEVEKVMFLVQYLEARFQYVVFTRGFSGRLPRGENAPLKGRRRPSKVGRSVHIFNKIEVINL